MNFKNFKVLVLEVSSELNWLMMMLAGDVERDSFKNSESKVRFRKDLETVLTYKSVVGGNLERISNKIGDGRSISDVASSILISYNSLVDETCTRNVVSKMFLTSVLAELFNTLEEYSTLSMPYLLKFQPFTFKINGQKSRI